MNDLLIKFLTKFGLSDTLTDDVEKVLLFVLIGVAVSVCYLLVKLPILSMLRKVANKTRTDWDDIVIEHGVVNRVAYLLPGIILYYGLLELLKDDPRVLFVVQRVVLIYIVFVSVQLINALLNSILNISERLNASWQIPFRMLAQIIKLAVYFSASVLVVAVLINKSPLIFFSGLGAFTAVLMLVFKDSILGFVAGIQLAMNDMVANGDWLEMPQYGADGTVKEIGLTAIKIQNWDMTISTVPTYALISDSFKNWRGMTKSGGRRIKRAINLDLNSIKFCSEEMLQRCSEMTLISSYIAERSKEIKDHNERVENPTQLVNNRRMTNIGVFRVYIERYLRNHPMSRDDMTLLVRQLPSNKHGLPIEIYFFCKEQSWAAYEVIQADIFDHLFAIAAEFELRVFQAPAGTDFQLRSSV